VKDPESFRCIRCKQQVTSDVFGTAHRNHCPNCLWSRHVDDFPGDRKSACQGAMEPIAVALREGEWVLIHQCRSCHVLHDNRIAGDDNMAVLLAIAARPLANPPVPLEYLPPG
jgi:DNA-directed RNA polymerase subunit RPC12/RpoP